MTNLPRYLSQAEVDALPTGTEVVVTWGGGNGPFRYRISRDASGRVCVDNVYQDLLDFVGDWPVNTRVSLPQRTSNAEVE